VCGCHKPDAPSRALNWRTEVWQSDIVLLPMF
jgi:hypothetical protein